LLQINSPSETAIPIWRYWVINKILRLSNRSAADPPTIVNASIGKPEQRFTKPSMSAEVVSAVITQSCAITCIHVPVSEMALPMI
jgi:hypothetical protein